MESIIFRADIGISIKAKSMDGKKCTRVLHIDAPPPFLRFVEKYCQSKGLDVDSTDSEAQGFHYALVKRYKAILIGAHAPRVDAGRILKGLSRARVTTPVFLLSESASKDAKLMGLHPNLMGLIAKPLDLKELSRCLEYADKPPGLDPGEREKILAVLAKWEKALSHGG
jgi:DNA-binding response OmpR family regulator